MPWRESLVLGALALLLALPGPAGARSQEEPDRSVAPGAAAGEPPHRLISPGPGGGSLEISAGPGSILGKDELILKEYVDIKFRDLRLQADYVRYVPSTRVAYAEGNVILDQGASRITAERLIYNLESGTGTFRKARGYAEPSIYFEAEEVEKISADELVLHDASFTACTQPIPYWSFKIGRGLLRLNDYAYLHDLSFKIGRVPVFYTPYLVWPIKTDRASGLLFPQFGFSQRSGTVLSQAVYWAIRRNMDATFYLDYLSQAGYGTGLEYRYVPNDLGKGYLTAYHIRDQVARQENRPGVPVGRWVVNYGHQQELGADWRFVANANFISDFNYYLDFERDIRLSTNPRAVSDLFLTRNWGFYSLNLRGERREQLVRTDVTPLSLGDPFATREERIERWIQPEAELRSRRQQLGDSPLFLTLESSLDNFRKGDADAGYQRLDAFPLVSSQLSPVPWLDLDASAGLRDTYYTRRQVGDLGCDNLPDTGDSGEGNGVEDRESDLNGNRVFDMPDDVGCDGRDGKPPSPTNVGNGNQDRERTSVVDDALNRRFHLAGLTVIGPKLNRVFERPESAFSKQYKHTIEPTLRYAYQSPVELSEEIIRFDEIDVLAGNTNRLTYGVVTRLFARRPVAGREAYGDPSLAGATYVGGGGDPFTQLRARLRAEREAQELVGQTGAGGEGAAVKDSGPLSTVEVATLEISQDYSFLGPLSRSTVLDRERQVSPIRGILRINPSIHTSLDIRSSYDVIFRDLREASLSANLGSPRRGFLDVTWSMIRDLEGRESAGGPIDRSQIGLHGETNLFSRRVLLGMQANYELGTVASGQPRLRDQRYRFGYNTQCCGLQFEFLNRNFSGSSQREFRFLLNLKGVGNVVDLHQRIGGGLP